ncbi:unnamed protein product [Adineta ricciae]|uniref:Uncharacterized protein n=1 Tax=Adineta ricciae TaxID=249248 RepID=A0A814MAV7_ADIRI|nr:unnamed protein product [Adineta ricciae]CAF1077094.1 unnamed protein product [Adineta ricciae]
MMSSFMVSPSTPTGYNRRIELAGMDLWLPNRIDNVYVYPGEINIDQLRQALSQTLSLWPFVAGRILLENDENYIIEMCDNAIPITVVVNHDLKEWPFNENVIIEADDQLFPTFLDEVPISKLLPNSLNEPLVRLKLTQIVQSNEWVLGISWYHALGDADACLHFSHALSQMYQRMESTLPKPIFERRLWREHEVQPPILPIPKQFIDTKPKEEYAEIGHDFNANYAPLNLHFSGEQLARLQTLAGGNNVSRNDALTAYIALTLNRNCYASDDERRILHTVTVVNCRGIDDSIAPRGEVSNALFMLLSDDFDQPDSLSNIAQTIRRSLVKLRSLKTLGNEIATIDRKMRENTKMDRTPNPKRIPHELAVNSNYRYDWAGLVNFGYKDQCRFYTPGSIPLYLRIFRLNPKKFENAWIPRDRHGAEVSFRLEKNFIEPFLNAWKRDVSENFQNISK